MAFPVTFWLLTHGLAFGLGGLAVSDAMGLLADGDALGAVEHFAAFVWAFNFAFWFLTLHVANCVFRFSAGSMTLGGLAHRVADGRAVRVVTFPGALRVALC